MVGQILVPILPNEIIEKCDALIKNYSDFDLKLTTSILPSTTINLNEVKINDELTFIDTPGFIEKDNWKIDLHKVYEFALRYGRERGFLCSEKEIARLLYEKGLTEVYVKTDRISYLKRVRIKGADLPMLCIKRHMMEQVLKR